jgi:apolipoprotein D and lipocalin family protein
MKIFFKAFLIFFMVSSIYADAPDAKVSAITNFESAKYLGTWYEIARIPFYFEEGCVAPITATYSVDLKNTNAIKVLNKCHKVDGDLKSVTGNAYFVGEKNVAELTVTFLPQWLQWLPVGYGDYWVLYTDYTGYTLVGSPDHKYLWILSRSEKIDKNRIKLLLAIAEAQGFNIKSLVFNSY